MAAPRPRRVTREELRALAHPLRLQIYEQLGHGPATAGRLGRALGESRGAMSYHLRVLAGANLIAEDATAGTKQERWWHRTAGALEFPTGPALAPDEQAATDRIRAIYLRRDDDSLARYLAREPDLEPQWREAAHVNNFRVYATPEEAHALIREVTEVILAHRIRGGNAPRDGARRLHVVFRALPDDEDAEHE
ncbi:MAG TPA: helix-turn-helix domain-containing protein [Gaiellaceae bacterium]